MANLLEMHLANTENAADGNQLEILSRLAAEAEAACNAEAANFYNKQIELLSSNAEKTPEQSQISKLKDALESAKQQGDEDSVRYYSAEISKMLQGDHKTENLINPENASSKKPIRRLVVSSPNQKFHVSFKSTPARNPEVMARVHSTPARGADAMARIYTTPARGADAMARVHTTPAVMNSTDA